MSQMISRRALGLGAAGGLGAAALVPAQPAAAADAWEVVVGGFNDAAVQSAITTVLSATSSNAVQRKLIFPPGVYRLTQPLLRRLDTYSPTQLDGLTIEGAGIGSTKIYWDNAGTEPFIWADRPRLRYFTLKGFSFLSSNAGNEWAYIFGDRNGWGMNQGWHVSDVEWRGSWLRVFGIDGDADANLNSEFVLERIYTQPDCVFGDAFFRCGGDIRVGDHNQQNQFLDYWIKDSCLTLRSGTVFKFYRGGSIRVQNGSWSAADSSGTITWFAFPTTNYNNYSVNHLSVRDVRFEPKGPGHKVIDCAWGGGFVCFDNCSEGANQNDARHNYHRYTGGNPWGYGGIMPSVRYVNCNLSGYHQYDGPAVARGGITYEGSFFWRGVNGNLANAVQPAADAALRWSSGAPRYRFADCWNIPNANTFP